MQRPIFDDIHLGQTVNPAESTNAVKSVDYVADFRNIIGKVDILQRLVKFDFMESGLIKYLPGITELVYQGMIYNIRMKRVPADSTYKNFQTLELNHLMHNVPKWSDTLAANLAANAARF